MPCFWSLHAACRPRPGWGGTSAAGRSNSAFFSRDSNHSVAEEVQGAVNFSRHADLDAVSATLKDLTSYLTNAHYTHLRSLHPVVPVASPEGLDWQQYELTDTNHTYNTQVRMRWNRRAQYEAFWNHFYEHKAGHLDPSLADYALGLPLLHKHSVWVRRPARWTFVEHNHSIPPLNNCQVMMMMFIGTETLVTQSLDPSSQ